MRSDIFSEFVKVAQENGLISDSGHAEHTEKDFHETNPRMDSLSIEQIGKLYNNKPPTPKEMEYKNNIMEIAHPDPLVISPSHDKLNGLIENEIEGQNIRIHISLKEPDGHLTQRKYAEEQLILSLVRTANDLDNHDQEELRTLADVCLAQTTSKKKLHKVAAIPLLVYPIAAAIGVLYAKNHMDFHIDGFTADYQKAISEIDDLLNSNSNLGVGYSYTPQFLQTVTQLKTDLSELNTEAQKALSVLDRLQLPHNAEDLQTITQQATTHEAIQAVNNLQAEMNHIQPFLTKIVSDFQDPTYKQRAVEHKGFFTSLIDSTSVLHGGNRLVADDFDDVRHALGALLKDVQAITMGLQKADAVKQDAAKDLSGSVASSPSTPVAPVQTNVPRPQELEEGGIEKDMEELLTPEE